jgi:hypothetical protein
LVLHLKEREKYKVLKTLLTGDSEVSILTEERNILLWLGLPRLWHLELLGVLALGLQKFCE